MKKSIGVSSNSNISKIVFQEYFNIIYKLWDLFSFVKRYRILLPAGNLSILEKGNSLMESNSINFKTTTVKCVVVMEETIFVGQMVLSMCE